MARRVKLAINAKFKRTDTPCRITWLDDKEPDSYGRRRFMLQWVGYRHVQHGAIKGIRGQVFFARPEDHVAMNQEV